MTPLKQESPFLILPNLSATKFHLVTSKQPFFIQMAYPSKKSCASTTSALPSNELSDPYFHNPLAYKRTSVVSSKQFTWLSNHWNSCNDPFNLLPSWFHHDDLWCKSTVISPVTLSLLTFLTSCSQNLQVNRHIARNFISS